MKIWIGEEYQDCDYWSWRNHQQCFSGLYTVVDKNWHNFSKFCKFSKKKPSKKWFMLVTTYKKSRNGTHLTKLIIIKFNFTTHKLWVMIQMTQIFLWLKNVQKLYPSCHHIIMSKNSSIISFWFLSSWPQGRFQLLACDWSDRRHSETKNKIIIL